MPAVQTCITRCFAAFALLTKTPHSSDRWSELLSSLVPGLWLIPTAFSGQQCNFSQQLCSATYSSCTVGKDLQCYPGYKASLSNWIKNPLHTAAIVSSTHLLAGRQVVLQHSKLPVLFWSGRITGSRKIAV